MTKVYRVKAVYKALVDLEVEVEDDADPLSERNWKQILNEHQYDFYLYDVDQSQAPEEIIK